MPTARRAGATLLDLTVALVVLAALLTVSVPRLGVAIDRLSVRAGTRRVAAAYALAREGAIFRARPVELRVDAAAGVVTVAAEADTLLHARLAEDLGVTLRTTRARALFSPIGLGVGPSNATVIVARGAAADTVVVSRLGRVRH